MNRREIAADRRRRLAPTSATDSAGTNALWEACLAVDPPAAGAAGPAPGRQGHLGRPGAARRRRALLRQIADQVRSRATVYEDWGFRAEDEPRPGHQRPVCRRKRHRQDHGRRGHCQRAAARPVPHRPLGRWSASTSARPRRTCAALFDAAEDGGAILFFDEADALFGKRSEVKDSHDRYANIEINYLLQRMEAYRGLAILATNMKSALDPAFMRRLRFIVNFPFPGVKERKLIWQKVFPKADASCGLNGTPVERLNYDQLAKLNMTGGNIHNIALNAAFLAAQAGSKVTMPLVLEAARSEFRKLERPLNEADFRLMQPVGAKA